VKRTLFIATAIIFLVLSNVYWIGKCWHLERLIDKQYEQFKKLSVITGKALDTADKMGLLYQGCVDSKKGKR